MSNAVTISVVIPAFNASATIARALDSVLAQTSHANEIIVVDDGCTDCTREVVGRYAQSGVKLINSPAQRGAAAARNIGLAAATGNVVAFLDADDEWLPPKLATQVELLRCDSNVSFVSCGARLISPAGDDLGDIYRGQPVTTGPDAWKALLAFNYIATPTVLAWREKIMQVGCFDETLTIGEDQDLWIKLASMGSLAYVFEALVLVHARPDSLSSGLPHGPIDYTLPMINRHIDKLTSRLGAKEIRRIQGRRLAHVGRAAYARGDVRSGAKLILRSMWKGYRPLESLSYLLSASAPAGWLKRRLGFKQKW